MTTSRNVRRLSIVYRPIWPLLLVGPLAIAATPFGKASQAPAAQTAPAAGSTPAAEARVAAGYGKLPLSFEANRGQTDGSVQYLSHGQGYTLFLRPDEAVLALNPALSPGRKAATPGHSGLHGALLGKSAAEKPGPASIVRMQLVGANPRPMASELEPQVTRTNYFIGNDPKKWHTDIPNFARVKYAAIYPGIDLVYYGNQRRLEHDFVVAPGANPSQIVLRLAGSTPRLDPKTGDLILKTATGELRLNKPVTYQEIDGERREVGSSYKLLAGNRVGFKIGAYDHEAQLTIDPVLVYSTYLGGGMVQSPSTGDAATAIAVDPAGNIYVTGNASGTTFPLASPFDSGPSVIFVSEINADGSALVYSTYLGSYFAYAEFTSSNAIAVDAVGDAYLAGTTNDPRFPTKNAYQSQFNGGDAFLTEIKAGGSELVYSTFLSGAAGYGPSSANAVAVDPQGNAYIAGETSSSVFPTSNAFQPHLAGDQFNAFVAKFTASGTLVYSTYLGGDYQDSAYGLAADAAGDAYVTGVATSSDFPLKNAYQSSYAVSNAFLTEFAPDGRSLVFSTLLGGNFENQANGIALDTAGNMYLAGTTWSYDFPTVNAYEGRMSSPFPGPRAEAFAAEFKAGGQSLVYSTYLGGTTDSAANAIAVDSSGNAYVTGTTADTDFPLVNPLQASNADPFTSAYVTEFAAGGQSLVYSTYLGGTGSPSDYGGDLAEGIAVDGSGNAYVTGYTYSKDFPTVSPFQSTNDAYPSGSNAFITKIGSVTGAQTGAPVFTPAAGTYSSAQKIYITDPTPDAKIYYTVTHGSTPTTSSTLYTGPFTMASTGSVAAIATAPGLTNSVPTYAYYQLRVPQPTFSATAGMYDEIETVTLADSTPGAAIHYTLNGSTPTATSPLYTVPIQVTTPETITAIGFLSGYENSTASSASYSPPTAAPMVSPATATFYTPPMVTITSATHGAAIYYTTVYGSTPTASSTRYTVPFKVTTSGTVAAIAIAAGHSTSVVGRSYYGLRVFEPTFNRAGSTYSGPIMLSIGDATPGATIHYTTDGTVPTASSTVYTGPIGVPHSERIEAIAVVTGYESSPVRNAYFTIH